MTEGHYDQREEQHKIHGQLGRQEGSQLRCDYEKLLSAMFEIRKLSIRREDRKDIAKIAVDALLPFMWRES